MLTRKDALEMVKWADKNNISMRSLFLPHIVFYGIIIVFCVIVLVTL